MTHTVIRKNFVLALALALTVGHPLAALAEDANTTQNTQDTLSTNQSVSQTESNMANRFYFAVGIGLGWGGPGTNPNQLFGFVPLTLSFGWSWMFNQYFGIRLNDFATRYKAYYPDDFIEQVLELKDADGKFAYITATAQALGHKLYLIVDEYDNFTNTVLNEYGEAIYHAMTHASGFYRDVFKKFKGNFDRILMLGVSPVTLDDLTSGYNIATNITMDSRFNRMLGFSETEVREMIRYYQSTGILHADEEALIAEMKPWYDGYCFSERAVYSDPKMFNCDMVAYYLTISSSKEMPRKKW